MPESWSKGWDVFVTTFYTGYCRIFRKPTLHGLSEWSVSGSVGGGHTVPPPTEMPDLVRGAEFPVRAHKLDGYHHSNIPHADFWDFGPSKISFTKDSLINATGPSVLLWSRGLQRLVCH